MTELWFYLTSLAGTTVVALFAALFSRQDRERLLRVMFTLIVVWLAGVIYVSNTNDYTPWEFDIFLDSAAAAVVMLHPATRMQAAIAILFFIQIAFHGAFGIREILHQPSDEIFYYDAITYVALAQLLAVGGWCGHIWRKAVIHSGRGSFDAMDSRKGVAHFKAGQ